MFFKLINNKVHLHLILMTVFSLLTLSALIISNSSFSSKGESRDQAHPNIIILLADDLGYGDISSFGQTGYQTPHIDNLAKNGAAFTNFYVPTPYCAPSRATLLTGRFPLRHNLVSNPTPGGKNDTLGLDLNEITMAEIFKEAGYHTKAIGKWHLGHKKRFYPHKQGFEEYYGILYSNDMRPVQLIKDTEVIEYPVDQNLLTKKYTQETINFIEQSGKDPFFLYVGYSAPHKPLAVSDKYYTPETPDDLYADVIRELDWSVGEIISSLKKSNILDNTIVIFMSDNGPWYGGDTGGLKGMKATTWEGGIRVPFIVHYPEAVPKNQKIDIPCWSPDIFPTLISLANITAYQKNRIDGINLIPIIQGTDNYHPPVFSLRNSTVMSVRKGDFKLFLNQPNYKMRGKDWVDKNAPDGKTIIARPNQPGVSLYPGIIPHKPEGKYQLFNLKLDPWESRNLAQKKPDKKKEMIQYFKDFEQSLQVSKLKTH